MKLKDSLKEQFKMHPGLKLSMVFLFTCIMVFFLAYIRFTFGFRSLLDQLIVGLIILLGLSLSLLMVYIFTQVKKIASGLIFFIVSTLVMLAMIINVGKTEIANYILIGTALIFLSSMGYLIYLVYVKLDGRKIFFSWYHIPFVLLTLISSFFMVYFFIYKGPIDQVYEKANETYVTDLSLPEIQATYTVEKGVYGQETFLDEFGPGMLSDTVNIGSFLNQWGKSRERALGFNINNVPLNGHYYKPKEDGKYPLVLIVHGNHEMTHRSDTGYDYLGNYLAERGYFCVSVDENFLNYSIFDSKIMQEKLGSENDARGYVVYKHIEWLLDSPFKNVIDSDSIALIGHSRGGEAITSAKLYTELKYLPNNGNKRFYSDFDIDTLIAIAPTDSQYKPGGRSVELDDVNYLFLQGSHDFDVSYMMGSNTYERVSVTGDYVKSQVYIYGANHGYFNENWHMGDTSPFRQYTLTTGNLMNRDKQETIARQLISYFLEGTLKDKSYLKGFENINVFDLPKNLYLSQYHTGKDFILADYNEDYLLETSHHDYIRLDGSSLSSWYESRTRLDGKTSHAYGVYMGGHGHYELVIDQPEIGYSELFLSLADEDESNIDLIDIRIEVEDSKGTIQEIFLSEYGYLQHYLEINLSKFYFFEDVNNHENVFQTFLLTLDKDLIDVHKIRIYMPRSTNKIIMKDIGLR